MYVVLGANGRAGGETARALIEGGQPVRVVLRRPEQADVWIKRGADVAIGSIDDVASIAAALSNAAGAFLLSPAPTDGDPLHRADEIGSALAMAVRRSGISKIVALSSIGAQHATGTGIIATLHSLERHLQGTAPSMTFLRPGYFVESWAEVARTVVAEGVLPSFLEPARSLPMVSTVDVGHTAARLLVEDFSGERVVELSGADDWSPNDVAAAFGAVLDRPVTVAFVPVEARAHVLAKQGVPPRVAEAILGMYEGLAHGRVAYETGAQRRLGAGSLVDAVRRIVNAAGTETP